MVEISEITNRDSLEEWLNTFSDDEEVRRKAAVDIAVRAALRVLPLAWDWFSSEDARKRDLTALPNLRSSLLSSVAAKMPTDDNKRAAAAAARTTVSTATTATARATVSTAAAAAARATAATARATVSTTAAAAVRATIGTKATIWSAIWTDCQQIVEGRNLEGIGLWPEGNPFEDVWAKVKEAHTARPFGVGKFGEGTFGSVPGGPWAFWLDWYEKELTGQPQDWGLLQAIVDQVDWDGSVEEVNGAIETLWRGKRPQVDPVDDEPVDEPANENPRAGANEPNPDVGEDKKGTVSKEVLARAKRSLGENKQTLPSDIDAIQDLLLFEIQRWQTSNELNATIPDECRRQVKTYVQMYEALESIRASIPSVEIATDIQAETALTAFARLKKGLYELPSKKVDEVVEGAWSTGKNVVKTGLILGTELIGSKIGLPPGGGVALGALTFAKSDAEKYIKAAKDYLKSS